MNNLLIIDVTGLIRVILSALSTYVCVVALIRIFGKRTTSQMNNFDWVVTVAIGSIVGSTIILKDLPLLEGVCAVTTLLVAQFIITKFSVHKDFFSSLVHAEPTIVFFDGKFINEELIRERITEQEILSAIRESGIHRLKDVVAVVLESDAKLSVLPKDNGPDCQEDPETLQCIHNYEEVKKNKSIKPF